MGSQDVQALLSSCFLIQCNYRRLARPEDAIYESLKLQYRGADKQRPSVLDLVQSFCNAIDHKLAARPRAPRRDLLEECIAEYNSKMANKHWRLVGDIKQAVKHLLRVPVMCKQLLISHLSNYKHEQSALSISALATGCFVPGTCRYNGCDAFWRGILTATEDCTLTWFERVVSGFEAKVPRTASSKLKASAIQSSSQPLVSQLVAHQGARCCSVWMLPMPHACHALMVLPSQKMQQLDPDKLTDLMDVCMVWVWLKPHLTGLFGTQQMVDVQKMWVNGTGPSTHAACCLQRRAHASWFIGSQQNPSHLARCKTRHVFITFAWPLLRHPKTSHT